MFRGRIPFRFRRTAAPQAIIGCSIVTLRYLYIHQTGKSGVGDQSPDSPLKASLLPPLLSSLSDTQLHPTMLPHPLSILSEQETNTARSSIIVAHPDTVIDFRQIYLHEPPKAQLRDFLALEHSGRLSPTSPRPARLALCQYDVIGPDRVPSFHESLVDVALGKRVKHHVVGKQHHASLTTYEPMSLAVRC
jgi:hypothetical protein